MTPNVDPTFAALSNDDQRKLASMGALPSASLRRSMSTGIVLGDDQRVFFLLPLMSPDEDSALPADESFLCLAARHASVDCIRALLSKFNTATHGHAALHEAAEAGRMDKLEALLLPLAEARNSCAAMLDIADGARRRRRLKAAAFFEAKASAIEADALALALTGLDPQDSSSAKRI